MQKKAIKMEFALFDDINSQMDKAFKMGDMMSQLIKIEMEIAKSIKEYNIAEKMILDGVEKAKALGATDFINSLNKMLSNVKGAKAIRQNTLKHVTNAVSSI
jgi:hypothetical protein